ncbi:MAG: 16S rRNA (guanine(527)-N(7))-methyltransferase RsmG [Clostridiales Family XIII bacterium]|jgi:16S rRNA (guanine527-N7)-methyltransferase|nr:16S rRNA (guanine(527)-N(7))-methyltransferase RsmG [Clostridiales Family XIII bacterium]
MDEQIFFNVKNTLESLDIFLADDSIKKTIDFWDLVMRRNLTVNLVSRKTDYFKGIITHIVDSLTVFKFHFPDSLKYLDFGSGGGFPGVVLKLVKPNWDTVLVESNLKKCGFLNEAASFFKMDLIKIFDSFIGPGCKSFPELYGSFDLITARAVSNILYLVKRIGPMLKKGGQFISFKGPNYTDELIEAKKELIKHNLNLINIYTFNISIINSNRSLLVFTKV